LERINGSSYWSLVLLFILFLLLSCTPLVPLTISYKNIHAIKNIQHQNKCNNAIKKMIMPTKRKHDLVLLFGATVYEFLNLLSDSYSIWISEYKQEYSVSFTVHDILTTTSIRLQTTTSNMLLTTTSIRLMKMPFPLIISRSSFWILIGYWQLLRRLMKMPFPLVISRSSFWILMLYPALSSCCYAT
jgi:hypothetical protein